MLLSQIYLGLLLLLLAVWFTFCSKQQAAAKPSVLHPVKVEHSTLT